MYKYKEFKGGFLLFRGNYKLRIFYRFRELYFLEIWDFKVVRFLIREEIIVWVVCGVEEFELEWGIEERDKVL